MSFCVSLIIQHRFCVVVKAMCNVLYLSLEWERFFFFFFWFASCRLLDERLRRRQREGEGEWAMMEGDGGLVKGYVNGYNLTSG